MDPNTPFHSLSPYLAEPATPLSRTSSHRQQFPDHEIDPLLSNLSPTSTLEALVVTDAVCTGKRHRQSFIQNSVASASTSERALGIKAAIAGKKLQEWYQELLTWSWPGYDTVGSEEEEYWGGLPARIVQEQEERIEIIRDDMESLEVEELKSYVRNTHLRPPSRSTSVSGLTVDYDHLDDFTAVITATIVQALPALSRLHSLLNLWTTRLTILRQVPVFLGDVGDNQESMLSAWTAVGWPDGPNTKRRASFSRKLFADIKAVLQDQISQLGRRLDTMLDLLEGSKDILPERWIDTMDGLEEDYSSWVVKAEEVVLHDAIDAERSGDRYLPTPVESGSDGGLPLNLEPPTHPLDVNVKSKDVQHYQNHEDDRVRSPVTTAAELPQCNGHSVSGSHLEDVAMRLDGPFNPDVLDFHDRSQEAEQNLQDGDAVNGSKGSPNPSKPARRPVPLPLESCNFLADSTASSDIGSDISYPGSATSDYFSNQPSPEVRSASIVEYVGSPALVTNPWSGKEAVIPLEVASGRSSLQAERAGPGNFQFGASSGITSPNGQRSRASTFTHEPTADTGPQLQDTNDLEPPVRKHHVRTRSASMQSFEVIPKHEIRRIMVQRSESYSSAPSGPRGLLSEAEMEPTVLAVPKAEGRASESSEIVTSAPIAETDQHQTQILPAPRFDKDNDAPALQLPGKVEPLIPLNSPHRFQQVSDLGPGSTPVSVRRKAVAPTFEKALPATPDDRLEARISSILTAMPTHIRLTSGPDPNAPEVNGFSNRPKTPTSRSPALRLNRAQTAIAPPTMTLAPAQPTSFKSRSQSGEPVIKLYHLHQSGKDVPIKLFVRLVGEAGERVMVRIGGGWADLAEYLKEYASHHGRRSISDTRFDIQGLPSSPISQGSSSRPASPISSKPSPAASFKRQQTTPGKFETPRTPASDPSVRPTSRTSWKDEDSPSLGLAGPKIKKVDISPRKQAWVEEMLEQARGDGGGAAIGKIGKVGGTQRVFFKARSRAPSNV